MSRRRALTDEQCRELATWAKGRSSFSAKAKELGISMATLRDAIARGDGRDPSYLRRKLGSVSRETEQDARITEA